MPSISGRNAHVYLQGSGADAVPLVEAFEFTIDLDFDIEEAPKFGDDFAAQFKGIQRWNGSIQVNHDTTQATIFDAAFEDSPRKAYFYPDRGAPTQYYYGTIWPRQSLTVPFGVAKAVANFSGSGPLARN